MTKTETYGVVKDGKLTLLNRVRFEANIRQFPDSEVQITVKKRGRRSVPQNSYYWGVIIPEIMCRLIELGNEVEEEMVHEFLKGKFNSASVVDANGEAQQMPLSTSTMNKEEFVEYVEKIRRWASECLEIDIPNAGEQTAFNY